MDELTCLTCEGSRRIDGAPCKSCSGTGYRVPVEKCPECDGTGEDEDYAECELCNGDGVIPQNED